MTFEYPRQHRILLVEDEESLAIGLQYNLNEEGYAVEWVRDGRQAIERLSPPSFDLVILDIMLPYYDGFQVAERIRSADSRLPILMLTAKTGIKDRLKGLETGADDYLTKPFHLEELILRVKRMLERTLWYQTTTGDHPVQKIGDTEIDFMKLQGKRGSETFHLTVREAMLLRYLLDHRGTVVSRQALLENVWGISSEIETRTVDIFISRLRKYIEPDPSQPVVIQSIRGVGYLLIDE